MAEFNKKQLRELDFPSLEVFNLDKTLQTFLLQISRYMQINKFLCGYVALLELAKYEFVVYNLHVPFRGSNLE